MARILSTTRLGRVVDIILAAVVLLAILDHSNVVTVASTNIYIFFFITPIGFLRLYVEYRYKKRSIKQKD
ncbi:hypothetical protein SAMN04488691_10891 [Haloferax larsenii]|uniref:Uncharacterized protein n=1 Tax=Haloferax larsenii TaxID=302484 RepID=A0A1H7T776_HALLR|nr:hypothetical protein SAMN04488691_10891 [Haloferax larsenii]